MAEMRRRGGRSSPRQRLQPLGHGAEELHVLGADVDAEALGDLWPGATASGKKARR